MAYQLRDTKSMYLLSELPKAFHMYNKIPHVTCDDSMS